MALAVLTGLLVSCSGGGGGGADQQAASGAVSSASGANAAPDTARSVGALCSTWWGRAAEFRGQWSRTSNADPVVSMLLLISAPSDLAQLFGALVPVAPKEIATDLEVIRDHLASLTKSAGQAATDPLAFAVGGLVGTAAVSGSFDRVNKYLTANCPIPPELSNSAEARTSAACGRLKGSGVDATSNLVAFSGFVDDLEATGAAAATSARQLRSAIAALAPTPVYGYEAIGRLRFAKAIDVDAVVAKAVASARSACGLTGQADTTATAWLSNIGPRPGAVPTPGLYGRCNKPIVVPNGTIAYNCTDHLEFVDIANGQVATLAVNPNLTFADDHRSGWVVETTVLPATGLEAPRWSAVAVLVDLVAKTTKKFTVVDKRTGQPSRVDIAYIDAERVVARQEWTSEYSRLLTVQNAAGERIFEQTASSGSAFATSTVVGTRTVAFTGWEPVLVLDATTGTVVKKLDLAGTNVFGTECPSYTYLSGKKEWLSFGPGAAAMTTGPAPSSTPFAYLNDGYFIRTGTDPRREDRMEYVGFDGRVRWAIPYSVSRTLKVIYGHPVVKNLSGAFVVVDPRTGLEATNVTPAVKQLLSRLFDEQSGSGYKSVLAADFTSGAVYVANGDKLERLDGKLLCP